jgi:hypothetical protein
LWFAGDDIAGDIPPISLRGEFSRLPNVLEEKRASRFGRIFCEHHALKNFRSASDNPLHSAPTSERSISASSSTAIQNPWMCVNGVIRRDFELQFMAAVGRELRPGFRLEICNAFLDCQVLGGKLRVH